jgi:hypothetical protein
MALWRPVPVAPIVAQMVVPLVAAIVLVTKGTLSC